MADEQPGSNDNRRTVINRRTPGSSEVLIPAEHGSVLEVSDATVEAVAEPETSAAPQSPKTVRLNGDTKSFIPRNPLPTAGSKDVE